MDSNALAEIAVDPEYLDRLSDEELVDVLVDLEELRARVWIRLLGGPKGEGEEEASAEPEQDQLLKVGQAAQILGVTPRWLYDHCTDLPFALKLAPRTLRFSERGLYRWLERRR